MSRKYWPVSQSYSKKVPEKGADGSFKINNEYKKFDIWHTGIDIRCPPKSRVIAIEDGEIIETGQFTGAPESPRWRKTWHITVKNDSGNTVVYGEVQKPKLKVGQKIKAGQIIGCISVVEWAKYEPDKMKRSVLHFELYKPGTRKTVDWWHKNTPKPKNLLNPANYLKRCTA
ncbi:MAG: M23 family metallopeptidase [Candidatus Nanoarchaeia archaeon]|nr:M23 family metallopeptidase [Candidatus Nanoarchaeia archaeon]MDD5239523.1 M23 family metallopeptidase [Candidatus Nanoarchaeia archaeon]